jgi:hypothetical protein
MGELGTGNLLIVGGARGVWEDLSRFLGCELHDVQRKLLKWSLNRHENTIMAVNEIGLYLHAEVRHWTSLHTDHLITRVKLRRQLKLPPDRVMTHSHKPCGDDGLRVDYVWPLLNAGALSGLFAAKVGLIMGFDRIVMAGCPMDRSGMFYDPPGLGSVHGDDHILIAAREEIGRNSELRERVRSLSGHTREWLGEPEETKCAV